MPMINVFKLKLNKQHWHWSEAVGHWRSMPITFERWVMPAMFASPDWLPDKFKSRVFRYGYTHGLITIDASQGDKASLDVVAIFNDNKGCGDFAEVMDCLEWYAANLPSRTIRFCEIMNERLLKHLIEKRGYKQVTPPEYAADHAIYVEKVIL